MSATVADTALLERFAPILERIAAGAAERDQRGEPALAEMAELRAAGIGALRVPVELGGHGASVRQLLLVLRAVAAADSNLPQALRQHCYQVELLLRDPADPVNAAWIERVVAGDLFGSAMTEPPGSKLGQVGTVLRAAPGGDGYVLDGRKAYGTGNAYAQWIPVAAVDEHGEPLVPVVPVDREGVELLDDWNGFGQRLTATATTVFTGVRVAADEVRRFPLSGPKRGGAGLHQAILLTTLAGIAERAVRDVVGIVQAKRRVYFTGTGELPRHDAIVQEQVGRLRAAADAAAWIVDGLARRMDDGWAVWSDPSATAEDVDAAFEQVELAVDAAQVSVSELVLDATAHLLDVLGASSLDRSLALDRHWRNARALASHNPYPFKARQLGDAVLNGSAPAIFAVGRDVGERA